MKKSCFPVAAAVLFFAGACAFVGLLGAERRVVAESKASRRVAYYNDLWKGATAPLPVLLGKDLLPPSLPGPLDAWAGGRKNSLAIAVAASPGRYRLELASFDAHEASPPVLSFSLNGVVLREVPIPRGEGKPFPYASIKPALTVSVPFTLAAERAEILVTASEGSWVAPARLRVVAGLRFNPAKALYLLLADARLLLALAALCLAGLFCVLLARGTAREAALIATLLTVSVLLTVVLGEALFREWLIRNPSQRALHTPEARLAPEKDEEYTYMTMVQPSADPEIPYEMRPGLDGRFAKHPLATNRFGMRGPELDVAKKPGTLRIAGLGDSVMMGWGVSYEETALTRIGRVAAQAGRPVETLNLGCPSYNTAVEAAFYKSKGRRFKPDLVLLIFMDNDFGFPGLMLEPVNRANFRKSYLLEQIRKGLVRHWDDAAAREDEEFVSTRHLQARENKTQEVDARGRWLKKVEEHYMHMTGLEGVRASLKDLADMLREDGARGIVVYNPIKLTVGDPASREKNAGWVVDTARELGLESLDMAPVYEEYLKGKGLQRMEQALWVSPSDWHPNAVAHGLLAEAVGRSLQQQDGLRVAPSR